jgi:(E)-4-hydroxy-3-methyl-but-2-enyl pyrophosphate reductase
VPEGALVIFSAHGVAPVVHDEARERSLRAIDATCPLITKVHNEARRFAADDYDILLIGHQGHEEVIGTTGEAPEHIHLVDGPDDVENITVRDERKVAWLSQTTLSVTRPTRPSPNYGSSSRNCSTAERRHLLCHAEPADAVKLWLASPTWYRGRLHELWNSVRLVR